MKKLTIIEIKERAKELGLATLKTAQKGKLIRAIQAAEGNSQCFCTGKATTCGQDKCRWLPDCH